MDRRCGGPGPGRPRHARPPEALVRPAHLRGAQGAFDRHGLHPRTALLNTRAELEEEKVRMIMGKLAAGTRRVYAVGWRWWRLFCDCREVSPLRFVREASRQEEEDRFLDFVVHLSANQHLAPGTIKTYLSAVRAQHLSAGCPDPTTGMARLWMAMDGLKRMYGTPTRKKPVTVRMLREAKESLDLDAGGDGLTIWAAILLAFFFLLRASEYCAADAVGTDAGKGVRGVDITFKKGGVEVLPSEAPDELVLCIRGSKTDQYNRGEIRNHFLSGDADLCVVTVLARYAMAHPDRYRGEASLKPLFPLQRGRIAETLVAAGARCGCEPGDLGTHSLRIGGASALWNTFRDTALVQRWGRWTSSAFQGYLWDARALADGVAGMMVAADFALA
jgi:hypothetical protein